jgi:hypothetical protein
MLPLPELEQKRTQIHEDIAKTEDHLKVLRGNLQLIEELIAKVPRSTTPSVAARLMAEPQLKLHDLVKAQARLLRQFTKGDLWNGIKQEAPHANFEKKSIDKPLRDLLVKGNVKELRRGIGNQPHVYEWVDIGSVRGGSRP